MDDAVGRVLAKVRELKQEENTLVFFYSDNGGPTMETSSRNDPLRGYKAQMFEGGIRVPFLIQWKGVVPAGQTYREMVMGFDCHATALAAAGVPMPSDKPLDGVDLIPFLTGKQRGAPHDRLFWRAGEKHAVRVAEWKLVVQRGTGPMLFNLRDDIGEQQDLTQKYPEKLRELETIYAAWDKQMMPAQWVRQDARNAEPGGKLKTSASTPATRRGVGIEKRFKQFDRNGDGKLTPAEFPMSFFQQLDKSNDGVLTLDQVEAYYGARRAMSAPNKR